VNGAYPSDPTIPCATPSRTPATAAMEAARQNTITRLTLIEVPQAWTPRGLLAIAPTRRPSLLPDIRTTSNAVTITKTRTT
jgi:hypothetical protein